MPIRRRQKNPAGRKTVRMFQQGQSPGLIKTAGNYPEIDPKDAFKRSIDKTRKIPISMLRAATRVTPVRRAIKRIANGILGMPFTIKPPEDLLGSDRATEQARIIQDTLHHPNNDEHDTYRKFIYAMTTDLLTLGYCVVERAPSGDKERPFRLWLADAANISLNPEWEPESRAKHKVPRFYDVSQSDHTQSLGEPFYEDQMFLVQEQAATYTLIPPSPVETAFADIAAYVALKSFQAQTTSNAASEYALDLGDLSHEELEAFRRYYEHEVIGSGKRPIFAGKGQANVLKFGANSDGGLYLGYHDNILKAIAMSFGLTPRDMGITEHDNRATAGAAADSGFQDAILPMAQVIMEAQQIYVVDFFFPGYHVEYVDTEPRTQEQETNGAIQLYEKGCITFNEMRVRIKAETMDDGDHFIDGRKFGEAPQQQEAQSEQEPQAQPQPGKPNPPQPQPKPKPKEEEKKEDKST